MLKPLTTYVGFRFNALIEWLWGMENFDAFDKPALLNFSRQKIALGNTNITLNEFKIMKYIQFYIWENIDKIKIYNLAF